MPEVGVSEEGVYCKIISCEVYPKLKNSIFFRINMKHSYFSNYLFPINFSVVETVICQKLIHVYAYVLVV